MKAGPSGPEMGKRESRLNGPFYPCNSRVQLLAAALRLRKLHHSHPTRKHAAFTPLLGHDIERIAPSPRHVARSHESVRCTPQQIPVRVLFFADVAPSYISYRQSYSHHPAKSRRYGGPTSNGFGESSSVSEERLGLMSAGAFEEDGDAVIEMDLLPPRWLDIQDEVTEQLAEIAKQTRKLEQLHQKHVLPGFDDEDVKKREEREIEQLTQTITRGFQKCQQAIKRIEMMVREAKQQGSINQGEEIMARNLKISLATRVGDVSAMFRKKQAAYLKSKFGYSRSLWVTANATRRTQGSRWLCLAFPLTHTSAEPLQ